MQTPKEKDAGRRALNTSTSGSALLSSDGQYATSSNKTAPKEKDGGLHPQEIVRYKDGYKYFGLKHSQLAEAIKRRIIPPPFDLTEGGRAKGWTGAQIIEHQRARLDMTVTITGTSPGRRPRPPRDKIQERIETLAARAFKKADGGGEDAWEQLAEWFAEDDDIRWLISTDALHDKAVAEISAHARRLRVDLRDKRGETTGVREGPDIMASAAKTARAALSHWPLPIPPPANKTSRRQIAPRDSGAVKAPHRGRPRKQAEA